MAKFEVIDGQLFELRRVIRFGSSRGVVIPRYMLRNLAVSEDFVYAAIKEVPDGLHIRFLTEEEAEEYGVEEENGDDHK